MTSKVCFENPFHEYSPETTILNESNDSISGTFKAKLQHFTATKLHLLTTNMEKDILHDGTVYTGSAGLAMFYFMRYLKTDSSNVTLEDTIRYLNIEKLRGKRISFLCGDAGPLALATVISYRLGDQRPDNLTDYKTLAQRLMSLISLLDDSPDELLYGKSGYLYALLFINQYISGEEVIPGNHIKIVVDSILQSGKHFSNQMRSKSPLLWQWHDKIYFGAAHGMAGILYLLLQARVYINTIDIKSFVKPTLDWLLSQRFPSGNFPSSMNSSSGDKLVQWCHGAPGFVPLCVLAYQVFEEDKYLQIALQCGEVIWQRGLCTKGYSLCHGVSGNAYAFIQLYRVTKDPTHLYRACCFMEWCAMERPNTELNRPDRPASLFEGLIGRLYLAEDLAHISDAKFPAFTL